MTQNFFLYTLLFLLTPGVQAMSDKMSTQSIKENYTKVIVLDKGVKRSILVPNNETSKIITYSAKQLNSQEGLIICFTDPDAVSIEAFEIKYGLKLQEILVKKYYLFNNISKYSDIDLINKILTSEKNIETLRPNWKMHNVSR